MRYAALAIVHAALAANAAFAQTAELSHGPILGRLSHDGVGVWARTTKPGAFVVRYGTRPTDLDKKSQPARTTLAHDNTGWTHILGLSPNTKYYYQVAIADGKAGESGSFTTLPHVDSFRDAEINPRGLFNFSFEFACGNNQDVAHGAGPRTPAFKTMLRELKDEIHFSIQNGDWLYEDKRDFTPQQWQQQVGTDSLPTILKQAPTISGVWENYKVYLERSDALSAYHRNVPTFFTFDDHEMLNDVWGAGTPGLRDRRAVFRDIGTRAWYDYLGWSNPISFTQGITMGKTQLTAGSDILTDPAADFTKLDLKQAATLHVHWGGPTAGINENELDGVGGDPNAGVYEIVEVLDKTRLKISPPPKATGSQTYSIGRQSYYKFKVANCEFFCCDTRTNREMHDTKHPDQPGLSMLGQRQKKWLLDGLKASDADFLFVVSSVNFMVPHVGGGKVRATNKDDAWTVFLDEREQLIREFDALNKRVCVLTGDLHNSFVIKITDRVWEFASGPHNSNNHFASDEGGRPATGKFKYGPREVDIRWSTYFRTDIPRLQLQHPTYCVVQLNNVFNNPKQVGDERWVAFERPQVIFQYFDGRTGKLRYAEALTAE